MLDIYILDIVSFQIFNIKLRIYFVEKNVPDDTKISKIFSIQKYRNINKMSDVRNMFFFKAFCRNNKKISDQW